MLSRQGVPIPKLAILHLPRAKLRHNIADHSDTLRGEMAAATFKNERPSPLLAAPYGCITFAGNGGMGYPKRMQCSEISFC